MRRTMVQRTDPTQQFGIELRGAAVVETRYRKGVPREYVKEHPSPADAARAFEKRLRTKRGEGFVHLTPAADVKPGGLRFEGASAGGGGGGVLDLSADGRLLVCADVGEQAHGCRVTVVDLDTGAERVVFTRDAGSQQTFVHAARFDADATRLVVLINSDTVLVDLESGKERRLASWDQHRTSRFNPFVVRPSMDLARRRCAIADADDLVKVVDLERGEVVQTFSTRSPTTECRGVALSPSGALIAFYCPSRGLVYGHDDARHDTSNELEVFDVATGERRALLEPPKKLDRFGFTAGEDALWLIWEYAQGPLCVALPDGAERWRFEDEWRKDRLATAYACAWSPRPGSSLLAVGRNALEWHDASGPGRPARLPDPEQLGHDRVSDLVFSRDGAWLAAWAGGVASVYRAPDIAR
ncbi:MAG: hypothetical protein JNJ54_27875 [Myxococcaceae bacterium]|nr:hypothetical protein [Myxococcaceae bacterium]